MRPTAKNNAGLTLIEVLIALAILAIALTAIIKAVSQNIVHTLYLQNRTLATLVGTEIVNEAQLDLVNLPLAPDHLDTNEEQLGQTWLWQASVSTTANQHIQEIIVDVFGQPENNKLAHLVSYKYVK